MEFREITSLIWNDKVEEFKDLVNEDIDYYVNLEDMYKKTLLGHATGSGKFEISKFLVENGADINHKDNSDYTPIHLATYNLSLDIIEYLLEKGANVDIAPKYSNAGIVGELSRDKKANDLTKKIIDKSKAINSNDLSRVLNKKNIEIAKYIIESKGVSSTVIVDSIREFLYGKGEEKLEFFKYLIDNKYISVNEKTTHNESLFVVVVQVSNDIELIKYLVDNGIDLHSDNNGITGLFSMSNRSNLEGVKFFVENGIDINSVSAYNQNAYHYECSRYMGYNQPKETKLSPNLKYLLDNGADIALKDNGNRLGIHNLHYYKRTFSVKYLYEKTINAILEKDIKDDDKFDTLFLIQEIAGNKKEKEILINALSSFPKLVTKFVDQLNDSKTKLREMAIKTLIKVDDNANLQVLKERSEVESNKNLLKVLNEYLETKKDVLDSVKVVLRNPKDFKKNTPLWFDVIAENENANIPISWLKISDLPDVLWEKSKSKLDIKTVKYLLKGLKDNNVNAKFIDLINSDSLMNLFNILYDMPPKINKDDMWIFNILFIFAEKDSKYIDLITAKIQRFVDYSRWAMGAKLLYPLAEMKNIDGLKKVDWYSRKFKHKGIKNDATYALGSIARAKKLTVEELRDSLIPDFGFNADKELVLDYGARKITVKLMPDFKYTFKNEDGKSFKTLPKPNKKDNEKTAKKSTDFFKAMKKEIKDILKVQKERLEYQFKSNVLKEFSKWEDFYVKNPVLNVFASNLFWGIYDSPQPLKGGKEDNNSSFRRLGGLKTIFRYNEDHSFSDINDDEITLNKTDKIGLVHPVELKEKELDKLKELIDDYEIVQPLDQVARLFFTTDSKEKELLDFKDLKFYTKSTHYKLTGLGWERGYIVDNGWFEDYNINIKELGLSASLEFSGADMYLEYMDDPSTWGRVVFRVKGKNMVLSKVDKRAYSEIYRTLNLVSQANRFE